MYNPSLREEPRNQQAATVPSRQQPSILDWLQQSGRLMEREGYNHEPLTEDEEVEEITELMTGDEADYPEEEDAALEG